MNLPDLLPSLAKLDAMMKPCRKLDWRIPWRFRGLRDGFKVRGVQIYTVEFLDN